MNPPFDPPSILLHAPQLGENIGSAARVMLNFGFTDLRLICPRDGWPNPAAETLSAGAFISGLKVSVHETLESAFAGLTYLVATTARIRGLEKQVLSTAQTISTLSKRSQAGFGRSGLLFGSESSGLPNEVVAGVDHILTYPVSAGFSSLNLAMAVGVFCSAWAEQVGDFTTVSSEPAAKLADQSPASRDDVLRLFQHFEEELDAANYFYPPEKTPVMIQNLRAALARADWTEQEVRTFRGAIKALAKGRGRQNSRKS